MIALFPARMNPPHLGHILTLLRIKDDYEKIIIALSDYDFDGKKPLVMTVDEVISILKEILKHFPNYHIIKHDKPIRKRTNFEDLPKFDIVVTGSEGVYNNMIKQGIKTRLIERTPIYRGEFIREAYLRGKEYDRKKSSSEKK